MPDISGTTRPSASILATSRYSSLHPCHRFPQHGLLFHKPHLVNLTSQTSCQYDCICFYCLETWQYLLALSLKLTEWCWEHTAPELLSLSNPLQPQGIAS